MNKEDILCMYVVDCCTFDRKTGAQRIKMLFSMMTDDNYHFGIRIVRTTNVIGIRRLMITTVPLLGLSNEKNGDCHCRFRKTGENFHN